MIFLIFVVVVLIAYFLWRIVDQMPDIVYRLSEVQRELGDLRRQLAPPAEPAEEEETDADQ